MRGLLLAVLALAPLGCLNLEKSWSNFWSPKIQNQHEPSLAAAARVDQIGRSIVAANPFCGVEPAFQVVGHKEPMLFHRDRIGIFVSDALVSQCKTDDELAAILAGELARMIAESRNLTRMGYVDSFAQVPTANAMDATNLSADAVRMTELAKMEERSPRKSVDDSRKDLTDPSTIAAELLRGAGYDEKQLKTVEPLVKNANKDRTMLSHFGAAGGREPTWSR